MQLWVSSASVPDWISDIFACMGKPVRMNEEISTKAFLSGPVMSRTLNSRGCFGCFTKPQLIIAVDEPSKGLKIQGRVVKKTSLSEDFWSSSTNEMENSTLKLQRSISSTSICNQNADLHSSTGSTSNPSEFVNHGLLLWNAIRQQWVGDRKTLDMPKTREPRLSWNATYENLLGTNKPFPRPIPLPGMVEFLVDVWEQDGLYD